MNEQEKQNQITTVPEQPTLQSVTTKFQKDADDLVIDIIESENPDTIKQLINMFNLAQTKKSVLRMATYNSLLDNVTDQMQERVNKRADQFSNKELLEYLNSIGGMMEKAQKNITNIDSVPAITINQQNNTINVLDGDTSGFTKESRQNIANAVKSILSRIQKEQSSPKLDESQEIFEETSDSTEEVPVLNNNSRDIGINDVAELQEITNGDNN